ncbi:TraR/DksA C4-type zinc finger protein [Vreelandella nanhaiensis]|uniref:TraR/DksA family transcriptional regulator n=1 Tax=Vreelandella nanhaiensis TaxID=1258546 RepID=A0A3S0VZU0_9GAMM|nr:TraR/DksA C4-type zinc finger protein [Halomonas nanhaiensis]RUR27724.1 TraR/DksA family transcriptional regulator [Halomonas nanhaiensis]
MANNIDRAAEITQRNLETALANRVRIAEPAANDECIDCGYEIPAARRQAAPWATTCIECQGIRERQARRFRE